MTVAFVRHGRSVGYALTLVGTAAMVLQGCSFPGKPPLPRRASIEGGLAPSAGTDFAGLVASAEIVYFPANRAASGARSEPAALLLAALQQTGTAFAIGWDLLDASQQPLLDELPGKTGAAREELISRLELVGTGRAREHCRAVLRDARLAGVSHLALRCPDSVMEKLEAAGRLTEEGEKQSGYAPPPGGFEAYAERLAMDGDTSHRMLAGSYRAHLASQQFVAERIVGYVRSTGANGKLLVFLRASDLEAGSGVPRYVAQKVQVRQLVLDSSGSAPLRTKLLTFQESAGRIGETF